MKNKKTIMLVIGFVVVAIISFYIGTKSAGGQNTNSVAQGANGFARNGAMGGGQRGMRNGGGFVSGQIVSKDANSVTVQLNQTGSQNGQNGANVQTQQGSKIVFYTDKTNVMKTIDGALTDLVIGKEVSINGTANSDGSVNANSIQIRPTSTQPKQ